MTSRSQPLNLSPAVRKSETGLRTTPVSKRQRLLIDDNTLVSLSDAGLKRIEQIQQMMNFHHPDSELSQINREATKHPVSVSPQLPKVLQFALQLAEVSAGPV